MKRFIFAAIAASMMLLGTTANAQISVGAGYLNSTQKFAVAGYNTNVAMNGVYAGIDYNYNIGGGFGIAPGIYYEYITAPAEKILNIAGIGGIFSSVLGNYLKARLDEHYINVPVNINFSTTVADGIKGFIYAGPTFSFGVASNVKANALGVKINAVDTYKHNYFNQFDMLVGGGIGVDVFDAVRVSIGYNFGALNRLGEGITGSGKGEDASFAKDNMSLNRNELHVGVAYIF